MFLSDEKLSFQLMSIGNVLMLNGYEYLQCVMFRDAYLLTSDCKLRCLLHLSPYLDQKLSPNHHRINSEEPVPVWGLERPSSSTGRPSSSTGPVTIWGLTYI